VCLTSLLFIYNHVGNNAELSLRNTKNYVKLSFIEIIKIHLKNEHLTDELSYYAFLVSLIPIPGVQQAGMTIDRIFANNSLKSRLDEIWLEINKTNTKISKIENDVEKFQEIAGTVKYNENLNASFSEITESIITDLEENTEWILETENWSYQSVLNSIIETDFAQIIAKNNSTNTIENTEIKAKKTHLHASNKSKNFIDNTKFSSNKGSVGMNGISTEGNIIVEGSGIGFGSGSSITFGGNPNLINGKCPFCKNPIQVDKRKLIGYSQIECHNCKKTMPFKIN
jgi:hypothetical protein